ncbi:MULTISPECIES: RNA polymerase sigma factor [Saccharibacillus]|uniref:RNA polymerase sigma factor n=1 Tax=Saccharibacillus brassicae TaxID=2583377 RepID=A0A4Y6UZH1_SACBS|nr:MULTISPECIES: RNA polymerase sigma factor [Saccharibacillus]MWJ31885.1 sigma-70 family RNA polymerase sigma factor [Saccharibacillus sp. WB 17]QDH21637.1 RNA polymerase sigma factor [Saccharibacillus brassicae]
MKHEHQEARSGQKREAVPGDERGVLLRQLMESYGSDVWHYAYFLTRSRDLADDIAQDTFVKAYGALDSFRGEAKIKTWLLSITRHTAFDYRRSAFVQRSVLMAEPPEREQAESAEATYMRRVDSVQIWSAIMRLPDRYREVLVLDLKHGLKLAEIAKLLGIAEGTVKSRLFRARGKVAKQLKEERG